MHPLIALNLKQCFQQTTGSLFTIIFSNDYHCCVACHWLFNTDRVFIFVIFAHFVCVLFLPAHPLEQQSLIFKQTVMISEFRLMSMRQ